MKEIDLTRLPQHIAIIMDGNGRWAERHALGRVLGHRKGANAVQATVKTCRQIGIRYLTLYAFSMENWLRPKAEVRALLRLLQEYIEKELTKGVYQGREGRFAYQVRLEPQFQVSYAGQKNQLVCSLIQVTVSWEEQGRVKSLELQTLRTTAQKKS